MTGRESLVSVRPLRRVRSGEWRSRDGRWTFLHGRNTATDAARFAASWHVYEDGIADAWGEPYPTLDEAVGDVQSALNRGLV